MTIYGGKYYQFPLFLAIFQEILKLAITFKTEKFSFYDTFLLWKYNQFTTYSSRDPSPGNCGKYETGKIHICDFVHGQAPINYRVSATSVSKIWYICVSNCFYMMESGLEMPKM